MGSVKLKIPLVGGFAVSKQRGFTLFELIVGIVLISILAVVALNQFHKLLVDVESASMELDLSIMRSAISMQVAEHLAASNLAGLNKLVAKNSIDLLADKPKNYLGVFSRYKLESIEKGCWFYDSKVQTLICTVRNQLYFETELAEQARARFKVVPVYSDRTGGGGRTKYISGVMLQELEPYRWLRPWG